MRFVYGEQYIENNGKTGMKEVVLMTAKWDETKSSFKELDLLL